MIHDYDPGEYDPMAPYHPSDCVCDMCTRV